MNILQIMPVEALLPGDSENVKLRVAINYFIGFFCNQLYIYIALVFYIEHCLVAINYLRKI